MKPLQEIVRLDFPSELIDHSVECLVTYYIGNDGIGAYEFWGQKCYDYGHDYVSVEDILVVDKSITEEERTSLRDYLNDQSTGNFDRMAQQASEIIETTEY